MTPWSSRSSKLNAQEKSDNWWNDFDLNCVETRKPARSGIIVAQLQCFMIIFRKFYKNEESVLNVHLQNFPRISFWPMFSAFVDSINLSGLKGKEQKPKKFKRSFENMKLSGETLAL